MLATNHYYPLWVHFQSSWICMPVEDGLFFNNTHTRQCSFLSSRVLCFACLLLNFLSICYYLHMSIYCSDELSLLMQAWKRYGLWQAANHSSHFLWGFLFLNGCFATLCPYSIFCCIFPHRLFFLIFHLSWLKQWFVCGILYWARIIPCVLIVFRCLHWQHSVLPTSQSGLSFYKWQNWQHCGRWKLCRWCGQVTQWITVHSLLHDSFLDVFYLYSYFAFCIYMACLYTVFSGVSEYFIMSVILIM